MGHGREKEHGLDRAKGRGHALLMLTDQTNCRRFARRKWDPCPCLLPAVTPPSREGAGLVGPSPLQQGTIPQCNWCSTAHQGNGGGRRGV